MPRPAWIDATIAAAVLAVARLWSPPDEPVHRLCGFFWLTGLPCPLCGLTRGLCAAAKGEWSRAFAFHALSPAVLALVAAWLALSLWKLAGGSLQLRSQARWQTAAVAILLGYGIVRIAILTL